jgi:hypothetical protein
VVAKPTGGGFAIPLPYGTDVDWLRNLQAADGGILQLDSARYRIADPRIVAVDELTELPRIWRALSRLYGIRHWLTTATIAADTGTAPARVLAADRPPTVASWRAAPMGIPVAVPVATPAARTGDELADRAEATTEEP